MQKKYEVNYITRIYLDYQKHFSLGVGNSYEEAENIIKNTIPEYQNCHEINLEEMPQPHFFIKVLPSRLFKYSENLYIGIWETENPDCEVSEIKGE